MSDMDQDDHPERRKRTVWLLIGGAASLLLPLLGALYLHLKESGGADGPSGRGDVFERRDSGEKKLVPSRAAVPPLTTATRATPPAPGAASRDEPSAGSSLDFVKPGAEMAAKFSDNPKPAPAGAAATAAPPAVDPAAAPAAASPPAKTPGKKGKKDFAMPKLQPGRGFSPMGAKNSGSRTPATAAPGAGDDAQDLLKNLPPGAADNPQLRQYLKQQGK